ncbi:metal-dependent transcriptional regulator [Microbacterium paulum]
MPANSVAIDDYLKTIYHHTEWQSVAITPSQLAAELALAPSTVTEMVQKLAALGLVSHRPYGPVSLTDAGRARAAAIIRRHRLIETWLVREFDYAWDEVHDEAEVLEHAISDRLLEGISARLGHPTRDPHGDAIPDASGTVVTEPFVLLAEAAIGHSGRVLRVSDRDPALLRALEGAGIDVGHAVTVAGRGAVQVDGGATIELPDAATSAVWITA